MIIWENLSAFAVPTLLCWLLAIVFQYTCKNKIISLLLALFGIVIFAFFIALLWINLARPPMRTMGETRLWYSFFLSSVGFVMYRKWKYNWILSYSLIVASVFIIINLLKPEIHAKNLMPALQSVWFVPHVTSYILSYSFLSASAIASGIMLYKYNKNENSTQLIAFTDNLVYVGFGLLMAGLLIGAVWAKEAWGTYWSWDPKETWAFATASSYLVYIHFRLHETAPRRFTLWLIIFSFVLLMITWKGVSYLPTAHDSVHTYTN
jgi:ABC-type transport system involved in cytochrome c biogenesis permease subunit